MIVVSDSGSGWIWDVDPASWETRACRIAGRSLTLAEWEVHLPTGRTTPPADPDRIQRIAAVRQRFCSRSADPRAHAPETTRAKGPAERKERELDTPTSHKARRSHVSLVAVLLMLALAASVVMLQAKALWWTSSEPAARQPVAQYESTHLKKDDVVYPNRVGDVVVDRPSLQVIFAKKQ